MNLWKIWIKNKVRKSYEKFKLNKPKKVEKLHLLSALTPTWFGLIKFILHLVQETQLRQQFSRKTGGSFSPYIVNHLQCFNPDIRFTIRTTRQHFTELG